MAAAFPAPLAGAASIEDLLKSERGDKPPSEGELRALAIAAIAEQFLDVPEVTLEMRAYLVQTTLPTVVVSLEKLICEIERRNLPLSEGMGTEGGDAGGDGSVARPAPTDATAGVGSAGTKTLVPQPDKPHERFDALNWLAQHLFRNNPAYANFYDSTSSAYIKSMKQVADTLRQRIADLAAFREAKRLAEEMERLEELERQRQARLARLEEHNRIFTSLLSSVYRIWVTSIWRKAPGQLFRSELIEEFTEVAKTTDIEADPDLYGKCIMLITAITVPNSSKDMSVPEDNQIFDVQDPVYTLDPATIDRWDTDFFVKMNLKLMCMWTVNQLSNFLRVLSSRVTARGPVLAAIFKDHLFVPKFKLAENGTVRDWLEELLPIADILKIDDPLHGDTVRKALKDFCLGKEDPRFQHQLDEETTPNADDMVAIAESLYKSFVKSVLGEFGPSVYRALMAHIKKEVEEEQRLAEKRLERAAAAAAKSQSNLMAKTAADARREALAQLLELVQQVSNKDGTIDLPMFVKLVSFAIEKGEAGSENNKMLSALRSHLSALEKMTSEQLTAKVESVTKSDSTAISQLVSSLLTALNDFKMEMAKENQNKLARAQIEQQALDEIDDLKSRIDLTTASASEVFIDIMTEAFQQIHPEHQVYGRISLIETAVTKLSGGRDKLGEDDSIESFGVVESFMRTIAASQSVRRALVGRTASEGTGIDYQALALRHEVLIENAATDMAIREDPLVKESRPDSARDGFLRFLGMPIMTAADKPYGAFDLTMRGTAQFDKLDVTFVERAVVLLVSLLAVIDSRLKAIEVAKAAASYLSARCEASVQIFMVETSPRSNAIDILAIEEVRPPTSDESGGRTDERSIQASPFLRPWSCKLIKVTPETLPELSDQLSQVCTSGTAVMVPEGQAGYSIIPLVDESGVRVAAIAIKSENSTIAVPERVKEAERVGSLLGSVLARIRKDGHAYADNAKNIRLDADAIDENTRRRFMFGKIVLMHVRDLLSRLDAKALAELRSYKKPPASIHRLVKGTLYIFGRTPKEVKAWPDAIKLFTIETVKKMVQYDPTAIQKKIRFTRAKRVLKTVTIADQRNDKFGVGSPAQIMLDWLMVVLELRNQAVAARRARPDLFDKSTPDVSAPDEGDEDEDEARAAGDDVAGGAGGAGGAGEPGSRGHSAGSGASDEYGSQVNVTVKFGDKDVQVETTAGDRPEPVREDAGEAAGGAGADEPAPSAPQQAATTISHDDVALLLGFLDTLRQSPSNSDREQLDILLLSMDAVESAARDLSLCGISPPTRKAVVEWTIAALGSATGDAVRAGLLARDATAALLASAERIFGIAAALSRRWAVWLATRERSTCADLDPAASGWDLADPSAVELVLACSTLLLTASRTDSTNRFAAALSALNLVGAMVVEHPRCIAAILAHPTAWPMLARGAFEQFQNIGVAHVPRYAREQFRISLAAWALFDLARCAAAEIPPGVGATTQAAHDIAAGLSPTVPSASESEEVPRMPAPFDLSVLLRHLVARPSLSDAPADSPPDENLYLGITHPPKLLISAQPLPLMCSVSESQFAHWMPDAGQDPSSQIQIAVSLELAICLNTVRDYWRQKRTPETAIASEALRTVLSAFSDTAAAICSSHAASFLAFIDQLLGDLKDAHDERFAELVQLIGECGVWNVLLSEHYAAPQMHVESLKPPVKAVATLSSRLCAAVAGERSADHEAIVRRIKSHFQHRQNKQAFQTLVNLIAILIDASEPLLASALGRENLVGAVISKYNTMAASDKADCRWTVLDLLTTVHACSARGFAGLVLTGQEVSGFLFEHTHSSSKLAMSSAVDLLVKALSSLLLRALDSSPFQDATASMVDLFGRLLACFPRRITTPEQVLLHEAIIQGLSSIVDGNAGFDALEHVIVHSHLFEHLLAVLAVQISLPRPKGHPGNIDTETFDALGSVVLGMIRKTLFQVPGCRVHFANMLGYHEIYERFRRRDRATDAFMDMFVDTICDERHPSGLLVFRDAGSLEALLQLYPKFSGPHQKAFVARLGGICSSNTDNLQMARQVRLLRFLLASALPTAVDAEHVACIVELMKRLVAFSSDVADAKALLLSIRHQEITWAGSPLVVDASGKDLAASPFGPGSASTPTSVGFPSLPGQGMFCLPVLHDEILRALVEAVQSNGAQEHLDFFVFGQPCSGILLPRISRWPESPSKGYAIYVNFRVASDSFVPSMRPVVVSFASDSGCGVQLAIEDGSVMVFTVTSRPETTASVRLVDHPVALDSWNSIVVSHQVGMFNLSTATINFNGTNVWRGSLPFPQPEEGVRGVVGARAAASRPTGYFPGHIASFALFNTVLPAETIQALHFGEEENLPIQPDLYHFQLLPPQQQPLLFVHPLAVRGNVCANMSTHEAAANLGPPVLFNVSCCSTRSFADALQSLGGLEVLYPLLCQTHLPVHPSAALRPIYYRSNAEERTVLTLKMISGMLSQSSFHMNHFIESDNVRLISLLLQQSCLSVLSIGILQEILNMRRIAQVSAELVNAIDEYLIFEPQIWSHASAAVQADYFAQIKTLLAQSPELAQRFGLHFWMDSIEQFFCRTPAGNAIGVQADGGEAQHAWAFAATLFSASAPYEHIQRIIESLWCSIHNPRTHALYRSFLHPESAGNVIFATRIFDAVGTDIIFRLLDSAEEANRMLCLDWLVHALVAASNRFARLRRAIVDVPPSVLSGLMQSFPLSRHVYHSLMLLATSAMRTQAGAARMIVEDYWAQPVRYPGFLKVLFDLLVSCAEIDAEVLASVWPDMLRMMATAANAAAIRSHVSHQSLVVHLSRLSEDEETGALAVATRAERVSVTLAAANANPYPLEPLRVLVGLITQPSDRDVIQAGIVDEVLVLFWMLLPTHRANRTIQDVLLLLIAAISARLDASPTLTDSDQQNLLKFANTVDEVLFSKFDIVEEIKAEYTDALYNWTALIQRAKGAWSP
nr:EF-hand calcium-binding domain-containing protein 5 [Polyrhizophydium stewartii]